MTAPPDDTTTDLHAVIAALRAEHDTGLAREAALAEALATRDAALAQRNSEYGERMEHQAATIDVLKTMSASPGDAQPVFDLIVRHATELGNVPNASLFEYDGELVHLRSSYLAEATLAASPLATYTKLFPMRPTRGSITCRAILDRQIVHVRDLKADRELAGFVRELGHQSQVSVPLMRDGAAIGSIGITSRERGGFSESQIALLQTFAEQAVIAISSAETYRALQTRTADLQELLEYQTATSDVLKVISRSTFDLQPVLDTVAQTAARLCDADQTVIFRSDGELRWLAANHGYSPNYEASLRALGQFRVPPDSPMPGARSERDRRPVHIHDVAVIPGYSDTSIRLGGTRTVLGVPLLRGDEAIGSIALSRRRIEPFTDRQIELVRTFADQAVIAIENTRLITEQREALEQQTATAEVLQVINASPGNLAPVFQAILEKAHALCGAVIGSLVLFDGTYFRAVATHGWPNSIAALIREPTGPNHARQSLVDGERFVQVPDIRAVGRGPNSAWGDALVESTDARTMLLVPLRKVGALLGFISAFRLEVRPFSEKEIALLENFAAQAVIAMENARLLTEQREALEQQTAMAEVLGVINASHGNLDPVFEAILERAMYLCQAAFGGFWMFVGNRYVATALRGVPDAYAEFLTRNTQLPGPGSAPYRFLHGQRSVLQNIDLADDELYRTGNVQRRALVDIGGARTALHVPLRTEASLGVITLYRKEVRPFTEKQAALLQSFAGQAVIAMENARLLDELRARTEELAQRQSELRVTFENMGDGVAMFDETPRLVAWNRKFQDILDLPDGVLAERLTFAEYIRYLTERGEFGAGADPEEQIHRLTEQVDQYRAFERVRPDGRVIEIRHNPVAGGGFVLIYADITERKRNEAEIRTARDAAEEASRAIEAAFRELKAAQANLIQAEKMASLGQLTAGIAHEIKNPLNFVNNFADLSVELLDELHGAVAGNRQAEIDELTATLKGNLERITEHGRRADGIVRSMLEHSRGSSAERRMVDLNAVIDEALNLAYHGARAQDQSFNITLERDFDQGIAPIEVNPQDMTRVFLNIFSNGFYAATRRARSGGDAEFVPMLKVTTHDAGEVVEIRVRDNGTGIPADIRDKLFQPFFTTKPTGEGTGLGLSITYDIVTKQHGGTITVDSEVDEFTEFVVTLPRQIFANGG